jgi:hypothetical protein
MAWKLRNPPARQEVIGSLYDAGQKVVLPNCFIPFLFFSFLPAGLRRHNERLLSSGTWEWWGGEEGAGEREEGDQDPGYGFFCGGWDLALLVIVTDHQHMARRLVGDE